MQDAGAYLQIDNRDGRSLGHLETIEIAQMQTDQPESDPSFQAFNTVLHGMTVYEKESLNFLLGDERHSPPTDLLREALAISGNFRAIWKVFGEDNNDKFQPCNPNYSVKVNLLRKKLFILAEKLEPNDAQDIIYNLTEGNFDLVNQQRELVFEKLIKMEKLSLNHCESLKQVLLDLKLKEFYKMFSGKMIRRNLLC